MVSVETTITISKEPTVCTDHQRRKAWFSGDSRQTGGSRGPPASCWKVLHAAAQRGRGGSLVLWLPILHMGRGHASVVLSDLTRGHRSIYCIRGAPRMGIIF